MRGRGIGTARGRATIMRGTLLSYWCFSAMLTRSVHPSRRPSMPTANGKQNVRLTPCATLPDFVSVQLAVVVEVQQVHQEVSVDELFQLVRQPLCQIPALAASNVSFSQSIRYDFWFFRIFYSVHSR